MPEYIKAMEIEETQNFIDIEVPAKSKMEITRLVERELKKAGITDMKEAGAREALAKAVKRLQQEYGISERKLALELGIGKTTCKDC